MLEAVVSLDRRNLLKLALLTALAPVAPELPVEARHWTSRQADPADYTLRIATGLIELGPDRIISTSLYNGEFPGPLLRFQEGKPVTVEIHNDTDTPEQLHWHGQSIAADVDGAEEEGTPFIAPHGSRRISFTPGPAGFRFYHSHVHAGADLAKGQYAGLVGPVYIEPRQHAGDYDREVFLTLKEFEPTLSRGGDMAMNFLAPRTTVPVLEKSGESSMEQSLAAGRPHGYEVGYGAFSINGRMRGHGEPIRVKRGDRVLFHILNGSATEIRSLALPGHTFRVVALDGNPVATAATVPVLWIGTGERISAVVEMRHPGVWLLGDTSNDDRRNGMAITVEYAGHRGTAVWIRPSPSHWDYTRFGSNTVAAPSPDQTIELTFAKDNAAANGFNVWTINGKAFSMDATTRLEHLVQGRRYRLRMLNASDDIHPIHLHRHTFELTRIGGKPTSGVQKDVAMLGGYQEMEIDFVADNPGLTLFHCHQQLHMDFGFMGLFDYA
jgi:FtsP/CotA-like multicopper oxidase with cupredoxin domain